MHEGVHLIDRSELARRLGAAAANVLISRILPDQLHGDTIRGRTIQEARRRLGRRMSGDIHVVSPRRPVQSPSADKTVFIMNLQALAAVVDAARIGRANDDGAVIADINTRIERIEQSVRELYSRSKFTDTIQHAAEVLGAEALAAWMDSPCTALDGARPRDIANSIDGIDMFVDLLMRRLQDKK
jgi:uncharacterized protein (DUF2384 family)